jgi:hypothetical protein
VDLELERVLSEREEYRTVLAATPASEIAKNIEGLLDVDLLQRLLSESLPAANKKEGENYGALLQDLSRAGIRTTGELQNLIRTHYQMVLEKEHQYVQTNIDNIKQGKPIIGTSTDRIKRGVYFTHVGLARTILDSAGLRWIDEDTPHRQSIASKGRKDEDLAGGVKGSPPLT